MSTHQPLETGESIPEDAPPAGTALEIVALSERHHGWVADLHVAELPHGLFPRLGPRFVRHWHRAHVASPHGLGYVALRDGQPVGFALGSTDRVANVDWIVTHRRRLAGAAAAALLLRPALAAWFLRTRARPYVRRLLGRSSTPAAAPTDRQPPVGPVAVLEAIVVVPQARTRGIGRLLVDGFLRDAASAGAGRVELVTKADGGAAGFYERGRWQRVGGHTDRDGDGVVRFGIDLDGPTR